MSETNPLTQEQLDYFHRKLLERRREIMGDIGGLRSALDEEAARESGSARSGDPTHPADAGGDTQSEFKTHKLARHERDLVREIDQAIERLRAGEYGLCEVDGRPISIERLEAKPWARRCRDHAEHF